VTAEANVDDLAQRLLRLEDERAIIRVLYKYAESIDYGDEAGWAACFTDDAVWDTANVVNGTTRKRVGREELLEFAAGHTRAPELYHKHMVVSPVVTVTGDSATSASYLQLVVGGPGGLPFISSFGRYRDTFRREADGEWRIAHRHCDIESWTPLWGELRDRRRRALGLTRGTTSSPTD
jgi:ketosteroid isomerase-like protein